MLCNTTMLFCRFAHFVKIFVSFPCFVHAALISLVQGMSLRNLILEDSKIRWQCPALRLLQLLFCSLLFIFFVSCAWRALHIHRDSRVRLPWHPSLLCYLSLDMLNMQSSVICLSSVASFGSDGKNYWFTLQWKQEIVNAHIQTKESVPCVLHALWP